MEEVSILKRSLVLVGKLVGVSAIWIALLSIVLVTLTGRAVLALSGGTAATVDDGVRPTEKSNSPRVPSQGSAPSAPKPNG